ncbi:MAG: helix-turn-helix transcriptional regulator [Clostridia bacterium]|nr:helix-turn-helix transcriptional regulator [Clostridia bacterium]
MKLKRAIALRISNLMIKNKIPSQYDLCKRAGLTESTLRNIINEVHETVNILTLIRICDGMNTTLQEFFNDDLFKRNNLDIE